MGDNEHPQSSAGNAGPRFTVINNSVFDRHERRTIAHFNLWNGTTEEMRQIVEGAHAATEPQPTQEDIAQALCGADGNGFLCDCTPTTREAYMIRADAVLALSRPEGK